MIRLSPRWIVLDGKTIPTLWTSKSLSKKDIKAIRVWWKGITNSDSECPENLSKF